MGELKYRLARLSSTSNSSWATTPPSPSPSTPTGSLGLEQLLLETSLDQKRSSSQDMAAPFLLRSSKDALEAIRTSSRSSILFLFTPVIKPAPDTASRRSLTNSKQCMDPFEPLGRALSEHHRRIRHVPYVPDVGMTETHRQLLARADAAIVVARKDFYRDSRFARSFNDCLDGDPRLRDIPIVLVLLDLTLAPNDCIRLDSPYQLFDTVVQTASYTPAALVKVADAIFRP